MKKENLRKIMLQAWQIFRATGKHFSECLKKAWLLFKLRVKMQTQIVEFYYQKLNNETRQAFGTLKESVFANVKGAERKSNELTFCYFDTIKNEFRAFKTYNLVSIC